LSVAKYYSPDGKAIQDNGVTPNVLQAEGGAAEAQQQADDDSLPDEPVDASKKPGADELLNKAIQVLQ
jgi:carboxyl-terminal processing protease